MFIIINLISIWLLYRISETVTRMEAFTQLTDEVILFILYPPSNVDVKVEKQSDKEGLEEARNVMNNILKRKLYKFVGQTQTKVKFFNLKNI